MWQLVGPTQIVILDHFGYFNRTYQVWRKNPLESYPNMPNCQPSHVLRQLSQLSTRRRLWRFSWFRLLGCLAAYDKGERKKPPKNPRHGYLEESLKAKDLTLYKTLLLWLLWLTETRKTIGNNFGSFLSSKPYISSGYQWSWETPWSVGGPRWNSGTQSELPTSPTKIHSAPWARPSFCHSPAKRRPEGHRDTLGITAKFDSGFLTWTAGRYH